MVRTSATTILDTVFTGCTWLRIEVHGWPYTGRYEVHVSFLPSGMSPFPIRSQ